MALLPMICSASTGGSSSRGLLLISTLAAVLLVSCSAAVPSDVSIVRVVATGSGCPNSTADVTISADKKAVTIPFRSFEVAVPTNNALDKEKSCMITIDLRYPAGWSYVGTSWTYQGWVELDKKLVAHQSAKYYYQGGSPSCYADHPFYGGNNGLSGRPYSYSETCDAGTTWSTCGDVRGLNVLTRIWIDNRRNPTGAGVIKSEAVDVDVVAYVLYLNWRQCP